MNLIVFATDGNVFTDCECIKGYAFKNAAAWVKCTLLSVICAVFGLSQGNCAHFSRIECLLPHNCPA